MNIVFQLIDEKSDLLGQYFLGRLDHRFEAELGNTDGLLASGAAWLRCEAEDLKLTFESPTNQKPQPDLNSVTFTRTWPKERWIPRSPGLQMRGTLNDGTSIVLDLEIERLIERLNHNVFDFQVVAMRSTIPKSIGLPPEYCHVWTYCPSELQILAFNPKTTNLSAYKKRTSIGEDKVVISSLLAEKPRKNRFTLEVGGIRYEVFAADDVTQLSLTPLSADLFPSGSAVNSLLSGLSFLHGVEFRPCGYCVQTSEILQSVIFPQRQFSPLGKLPLPDFRKLFVPPNGWDDCWIRLLRSWLEYSEKIDAYTYIRPILHSADAPFDVQAQVLTAMTEGLSRKILDGDVDPNSEMIKFAARTTKKFLKKWKKSKNTEFKLEEAVYNRMCGALGRLNDFSSKDAINGAAKKLKTDALKHEIDAWAELRHVRAHGSVTKVLEPEQIELYNITVSLFYRLCLKLVGYSGRQQLHSPDKNGGYETIEI